MDIREKLAAYALTLVATIVMILGSMGLSMGLDYDDLLLDKLKGDEPHRIGPDGGAELIEGGPYVAGGE